MTEKIKKFASKNNFGEADIKYIIRENSKTSIYLLDGRIIDTYIPVKEFANALSSGLFLNISKGILVSKDSLEIIKGETYILKDGKTFNGRKNHLKEHRINSVSLTNYNNSSSRHGTSALTDRLALLDDMPVAFCVFEIVYTKDGKGKDFVLRYCNKEIEILEGLKIRQYVDKDLPDTFKKAAKQALSIAADIALNGGTNECTISRIKTPQIFSVKFFQPVKGFCGCILSQIN